MADILDIATYVLEQTGSTSTMKLQKLVYYSQALHLVRYGSPLFDDRIEAWANGPIITSLFDEHRHKYIVNSSSFGRETPAASRLSGNAISVIDYVVKKLGSFSGADLSKLTHSESPWKDARGNLPEGARSTNEITQSAIKSFYESASCKNPVFA